MAGMQFEYDEKGGTFYYFLLSFMSLVLIPSTYYLWPSTDAADFVEKSRDRCNCEACVQKKLRLRSDKPRRKFKRRALKVGFIIGWVLFALVAYKASQVELDFKEFDPYSELGIDRGATVSEIKKAYRKLSVIHHPDKETGDEKVFMRITKAYKALTDEEMRKNWEEHGNPDGPGATVFGIALPSWIIEKQNSVWVLAAYGLVFMVILPVAVGTWWYRSIKYSAEQILMDTTQIYFYFFHKTPNMMLKRVLMILAASMEFEKNHNNEIVERPSDNEELPQLMRDLPQLNEKTKEKPLCYPYSVKSRALLHAHFSRLELPPKTLELDKQYILKKCPHLINEMVNIVAQLVAMAHAGRVNRIPRLETLEHCMKLSQMVTQGQWDNKSPLLQLPHITEDTLRHFTTRRRNIRTIMQFVSMKDEDRRSLLRGLNDEEYQDVMNVCRKMPHVKMEVRSEVRDDEDKTITAGSIVTVTVQLDRDDLGKLDESFIEEEQENTKVELDTEDEEEERAEKEELAAEAEAMSEQASPQKEKPKVWEKQKKKKGGKGRKKPVKKEVYTKKIVAQSAETLSPAGGDATPKAEEESSHGTPNGSAGKTKKPRRADHSTDDESSGDEGSAADDSDVDAKVDDDADEDRWQRFQDEHKKENPLEAKSKETHIVHCPYYPVDKHEWWWLYVADKKSHMLISAPVQICSLKESEEVSLKFSAPSKPGLYQYTVILRSDSYLDFDQTHNIKLDVKEAKKIESHPQWDISDDEDKEDEGSETEGSSDDDYSDDD